MSNVAITWARRQQVGNPAGMKAVLIVHADHANEFAASWPKKETVAAATGLSKRTVENYERGLIKIGLLIPVPWVFDDGTEGRKGFFLGCARRSDGTLPDVFEAFRDRMSFKSDGDGRRGAPRLETPSWWSGDKTSHGGHKCTSCGRRCHGSDDEPAWDPGEGPTDGEASNQEPTPDERPDIEVGTLREGPMGPGGWSHGEGGEGPTAPAPESSDRTPMGVPPAGPGEGPTGWRGEGPAGGTPLTLSVNPHHSTPSGYAASARSEDLTVPGGDSPAASASADAPATDGLRPRGSAAPEKDTNAEPRESPAGPGWLPEERTARLAEWDRIFVAIRSLPDEQVAEIESAIIAVDWRLAKRTRQDALNRYPDASIADAAKLAVMFALTERPLATWPQEILPDLLRAPQQSDNPSPSAERY